MKFIVHYGFSKNASQLIYNVGRRMLYFIDESMFLSGIGMPYHYVHSDFKKENFNFKLDYLIREADDETRAGLELFKKNYKQFLNLKNKDSKIIVQTNIHKRDVENFFTASIDHSNELMENSLGITTFKELHDDDKVNFYQITEENSLYRSLITTSIEDILSLQIADSTDDVPVLFLGNEDKQGNPLLDIETNDVLKKDFKNGYLVDVFQFPVLNDVRTAEMKAITHEFSKEIQSIKEQLNQWAKIAFNNPSSSEAQQFFIKKVMPMIETKKRSIYQINAGKDVCSRNPDYYTFQLQFGELPIEKIWELYKVYDHITEQEYQNLLKIKAENPKKYTGRWPVAFFKTDYKNVYKSFQPREQEQTPMPTTRKTLDID
ncbi:hypothetical protein [Flavobacterium sp.]